MKKNVIFIQNEILHYRIEFYNELAKQYNLTVIHSGEKLQNREIKFKQIVLPITKIGPFLIQNKLLKILKKENYDTIIAMFDLRWLFSFFVPFIVKRSDFIWWGLDVGKGKIALKIKLLIAKLGYPIIFYNKFNRDTFIELGLNRNYLSYANNTYRVEPRRKSYENDEKSSIIFVGSFDKRKQLDVCIRAFKNLLPQIAPNINFELIGSGEEESSLKELVSSLKLNDRVKFIGRINDSHKIGVFYNRAILSLSFGQAGLSVLQSLGFGVPFITKINAISGGEKSNIIHGYNGFFCDDDIKSLEMYMLRILDNKTLAQKMGENSYNYYSDNCTIENMARGFVEVIEE